ncbi:cupredoxin domain-containing protein [Streptomyces sp. NPDC096339]|uniref:cupredoxin domain-containing protein n=1 Tax=Streptomyces sp. NPDC096339 TaxID=3366086 RepID=UPI003813E754
MSLTRSRRSRHRTRAAAVGAACALFAVVGVTSTSAAAVSAPAATSSVTVETAEVHIKDFKFNPAKLTVKPGTKVTVVNEDSTPHTLTASDGYAFDTGTIEAGASGSFTAPTKVGTYPFVCSFHPQMTGTLTVK